MKKEDKKKDSIVNKAITWFKGLETKWKIIVIFGVFFVVFSIPYIASGQYSEDVKQQEIQRQEAEKKAKEEEKKRKAEEAKKAEEEKKREEANKIIDEIEAFNACERRGKFEFPYGFKIHSVLGMIANQSIDNNTGWYFKYTVDITNGFGATMKDKVMECKVHGTTASPSVDYFMVY